MRTLISIVLVLVFFNLSARVVWPSDDTKIPPRLKQLVEIELTKNCPRLILNNDVELFHFSKKKYDDDVIYFFSFRNFQEDYHILVEGQTTGQLSPMFKITSFSDVKGCY
ncbi:MAG: hypothetical protein HOO06_05745 [Bdellovibrionaceae bacterium]|jgi:hypothetical protein|nr:hypothetical protein [Pseudobdellovibrionaceae bacterium]